MGCGASSGAKYYSAIDAVDRPAPPAHAAAGSGENVVPQDGAVGLRAATGGPAERSAEGAEGAAAAAAAEAPAERPATPPAPSPLLRNMLPPRAAVLAPPNARQLENRLGHLFASLPEPEPAGKAPPEPPAPEPLLPQRPEAEPEPQPEPEPDPEPEPPKDSVLSLLRTQKQQAAALPSSAPFHAFLRRPRLARTTCAVAAPPEPPAAPSADDTAPARLLSQLPHELLLEVLERLSGRSLCRAACVCRRLHRAIFAPDHDRVLWRPLTLTMAADGVRPRRGTGCTWREVFLRLIGIEAVSRKCRLLEVSAAPLATVLGCVPLRPGRVVLGCVPPA